MWVVRVSISCVYVCFQVELLPGGESIGVTAANRLRYIHLVADYYLNVQIRSQSEAFIGGMREILPADWLQRSVSLSC